MKKKLSLLLCLVFMVLGLTACGTDPKDVDYFGTEYDKFSEIAEYYVNVMSNLTKDQIDDVQSDGDEIIRNLVNTWVASTEDLGAYVGLGEFSITKAQSTVTTEQIVVFEEREICMTFVYEYDYAAKQLMIKDANTDLVYTTAEKMGKAGLNTLMGMGTVFLVLILISLIIYAFNLIPVIQKMFSGTKEEETPKEPVAVASAAPVTEQLTDDLELVAVITAAIAASEGTPVDGLVVRSIRRR